VTGEQRDAAQLRELCERAAELAGSLPGPVRRVSVRWAGDAVEVEWPDPPATGSATPAAPAAVSGPDPAGEPASGLPAEIVDVVRTPVVGTFYHAPAPGAEPFVTTGSVVEAGQTLGIVEAMKLLNDIVAERPGRVVEICAGNGAPVEFGQPLMRIEPAGQPAVTR
jgi:acetyl-CoA carboxylase biotin carboxyl carrier protein